MTKNSDIRNFLLVYDRHCGRLVSQQDFGNDATAAVAEYQRLERLHRNEAEIDIVLVGSDSIESVMVTHANYFRSGTADLEEYLRSVVERQGIKLRD